MSQNARHMHSEHFVNYMNHFTIVNDQRAKKSCENFFAERCEINVINQGFIQKARGRMGTLFHLYIATVKEYHLLINWLFEKNF